MNPCPGCGALRKTRSPDAYCHTCRKAGHRQDRGLPHIHWMLAEAARIREAGMPTDRYPEIRAARHPWLTIAEAAHELDVTEGRVYQLIGDGTFTTRIDPRTRKRNQVRAADVFAYFPQLRKKRTTS